MVSLDADDFSIAEGCRGACFKPKAKGRGRQGRGDMDAEKTAEILWQPNFSARDYHAAIKDTVFMEGLGRRLTPAFKAAVGART